MQLHQLQPKTKNKKKKRVGRGGKRGKTSGRGHKGQKQHGGTPRPALRDTIKKIPKRRGYGQNRARTVHSGRKKYEVVNLSSISKVFANGDTVSPETLVEKGLVRKRGRQLPDVKVLGQGVLTKSVTFSGVSFSDTAREQVTSAGASVK